MIKILKNVTGSPITLADVGITIPALSQYTIDPVEYGLFARSTDTIGKLSSGDIVMNNGTDDLPPLEGIAWLQGDLIFNSGAKEYTISNVVVTTNYAHTLQTECKAFQLKATNKSVLTIKKSIGGSPYTIPVNCSFSVDNLALSATVLYISSSIPATTVEIIEFFN